MSGGRSGREAGERSTRDPSYDHTVDPEGAGERATTVPRWGRPTALQRLLGGVVGAVLGGLLTVGLLVAGVGHWAVGVPIAFGAGVGAVYCDRGIRAIVRVIDASPFP